MKYGMANGQRGNNFRKFVTQRSADALQAMLGSDIRRENHNLVRVNCTQMRPWDVLYDWKFKYYWKFRGHKKNEYRTLSRERPDVGLSKQVRRLIRKWQRRRSTPLLILQRAFFF